MASKYIDNGSYAVSGYTLSGAFQSITVGSKGTIGGPGLHSGTKEAYTTLNRGQISGSSVAVLLQDGGTIDNAASGRISGASGIRITGAKGTVINQGTINSTGIEGVGVQISDSGTITNSAHGLIMGKIAVRLGGADAELTNAGTIISDAAQGVGVWIGAAAEAKEVYGGSILADGSAGIGVYVANGATFVDQGHVAGTSGDAIKLESASSVLVVGRSAWIQGTIDGNKGTLDLVGAALSGAYNNIAGFGLIDAAAGIESSLFQFALPSTTRVEVDGTLQMGEGNTPTSINGTIYGGGTLELGNAVIGADAVLDVATLEAGGHFLTRPHLQRTLHRRWYGREFDPDPPGIGFPR